MKKDENWNTSTEMPDEYNNRIEIELIKRDVGAISKLCEKMDITIDKLQQVAGDISRIVSLQEQKMQLQDKINEEVEQHLEKNQKTHIEDIRELNSKIHAVNDDLSRRINQVEATILTQMERQTDEISKKINTIESWRYMVMGGIALAVFILSQLLSIDISKLLH